MNQVFTLNWEAKFFYLKIFSSSTNYTELKQFKPVY